MILQTFVYPDLAIHTHLVGDPDKKECVIIDPPRVIDPILSYLKTTGLKLKGILETHVHADFISGARELKHAFNNTPLICCSEAGGAMWRARYTDRAFNDGDTFSLGSVMLRARHTPGHTPEHLSWLCFDLKRSSSHPTCLFTGDFLFLGGVGRPDLLGPNMTTLQLREIHKSLFGRINDLPDALKIFPSHGAGSLCGKSIGTGVSSTLGEQRRLNPAFGREDFGGWLTHMQANMPVFPKAFTRNKKINVIGAPLLETLPQDNVEPDTNDIETFTQDGWIFDFRDPASFGTKHLKRAVNLPPSPSIGNWLAGLLPDGPPILCILGSWDDKKRIANLIRVLGYDQPLTFALWDNLDEEPWPVVALQALPPQDLQKFKSEKPQDVFIVDVRTPAEWESGHLENAHHIEVLEIEKRLNEIPTDKRVVLYCRSGSRSSVAASIVQRAGYKKVSHLAGGITAWEAAALPTTKE